jgi:hypothetical protein
MKPPKTHKLRVRNKHPGISTGANTKVMLDGKPLTGVHDLQIHWSARDVTEVIIKLYANVEVEGEFALGQYTPVSTKSGRKTVIAS